MKHASMITQPLRKGLRIILFACLCLMGIASANAQQAGPLQKTVTLHGQNTGLIQLLNEIEQQTKVRASTRLVRTTMRGCGASAFRFPISIEAFESRVVSRRDLRFAKSEEDATHQQS